MKDVSFYISTGHSIFSKNWKNKKTTWHDLRQKLSVPTVTAETFDEYIKANKAEKLKIKDVGGYVGGFLRDGKRHPQNVVMRSLLTLDIDYAEKGFWDDFALQFDCAAVLHSTHSHTPEEPRYRLIIPLSKKVTPDQYVAIARQVAGVLNIELFDDTTFEVNRLMFWPSASKGKDYYFQSQDGDILDPEGVLKSYEDWTDISSWPVSSRGQKKVRRKKDQQENPLEKKGLIGAFCRTFSIEEAIDTFLAKYYESTSVPGRYTYKMGSTAGGLITYDDAFAYSHHGTDPISGELCNAFDLVRVHRFGHLDDPLDPRPSFKRESFRQMEEFVAKNIEVRKTIAAEKQSAVMQDFGQPLTVDGKRGETQEEPDLTWAEELDVNRKGEYLSTSKNIRLIFANDQNLKSRFAYNIFDGKNYVQKGLPWRKIEEPEPFRNVDFSGIRSYFETAYNILGSAKIDDALALTLEVNSFNPVKDYLSGLLWDGQERIDNILPDFLGADKNTYTAEAMRKSLVAAVARVFKPGTKFDFVTTLVGDEGVGKSTLLKKLGGGWFSDSFTTVHGKESFEQLQGAWIIEIAELSGLRKAETESVKHFISKTEDIFRPAYGRTTETRKRQCVFFATTNEYGFLKSDNGNRRFWPVDVHTHRIKRSVFKLKQDEVDQYWAEAVELYRGGEKLYMSKKAEKLAAKEQQLHLPDDERVGMVEAYLDMKLPTDWAKRGIYERRNYLTDPLAEKGSVEREYVCAAEIWCECFGKSKEDIDKYKTRGINSLMRFFTKWKRSKSAKSFPLYGKQRYYYLED